MSKNNNRKDVVDYIVNDFCNRRGINRKGIPAGLESSIVSVSVPFFLFIESLDDIGLASSEDPVDGLLSTLINRCFDAVTGSLALIAVGHLQEAEVLARTVMESALTFLYIGSQNPGERFIRYFTSYIETEKKQNRNWEKSLGDCDEITRNEHIKRIKNKDEALELYEHQLKAFAKFMSVSYPQDERWPSRIEQKFSALGRELDYRAIYAAMCSQSHHDAEDILNRLIVDTMTGIYSAYTPSDSSPLSFIRITEGMTNVISISISGFGFALSLIVKSISHYLLTGLPALIHRVIPSRTLYTCV